MNKSDELGAWPINKLILHYAVPSIISLVISSMYTIVNRIFIGHIPGVGALALTAIGLTAPVTTFLFSIAAWIAVGASSSISIRLGQGKKAEAEAMAGHALLLSVLVGLVLSLLYTLFQDPLFQWLGIRGEGLSYAKDYMDILMWGAVFQLQSFIFPNLIRSSGNPRFSAVITAAGCLLNIGLDVLFINLLQFGIRGAAMATVLSQLVMAGAGAFYFAKGKSVLLLARRHFALTSPVLKPMLLIGMVPFMNQMSISISQAVSNYSLARYGGEAYIASMAAITSVIYMALMIVNGFSQAAQTIAGFNYSRGNQTRAFQTLALSVVYSSAAMLVSFGILQGFPGFWAQLFSPDPQLIEVAAEGLLLYSFVVFLAPLFLIGSGFLMVTGKPKTALVLVISKQCLILMPLTLLLPPLMGTKGLWLAQPLTDLVIGAAVAVILLRLYKAVRETVSRKETVQL